MIELIKIVSSEVYADLMEQSDNRIESIRPFDGAGFYPAIVSTRIGGAHIFQVRATDIEAAINKASLKRSVDSTE